MVAALRKQVAAWYVGGRRRPARAAGGRRANSPSTTAARTRPAGRGRRTRRTSSLRRPADRTGPRRSRAEGRRAARAVEAAAELQARLAPAAASTGRPWPAAAASLRRTAAFQDGVGGRAASTSSRPRRRPRPHGRRRRWRAWLDAEAAAVEAEAAALERVVGAAPRGKDLPPATCGARTAGCRTRRRPRPRSPRRGTGARPTPVAGALEATDWSDRRRARASSCSRSSRTGARRCRRRSSRRSPMRPPASGWRPRCGSRDGGRGDGFDESWDVRDRATCSTRRATSRPASCSTDVPLAGPGARGPRPGPPTPHRLDEWVRFVQVERDAAALGRRAPCSTRCGRASSPLDQAADAFRARFFRLWLDALHEQVPALARVRHRRPRAARRPVRRTRPAVDRAPPPARVRAAAARRPAPARAPTADAPDVVRTRASCSARRTRSGGTCRCGTLFAPDPDRSCRGSSRA